MGNHASRRTSSASAACKVILGDGSAAAFDVGTSVAELMLEHPQQFVVEFGSLLAGNKPSPLAAHHKLETRRVYVMLPMKPGKAPTLSAAEARQALSRSRSVLRSGVSFPSWSSSKGGPQLRKWGRPDPGGLLHADGEEVMKAKPGKMESLEFPSQAFGEVPEFPSRQRSGKLWKPSLHTIEERAPQRKVPHWLVF